MKTMRYEKPKSPGVTVLLIFLCTLVLAALTIIGFFYSYDALDKWQSDLKNQVKLVIVICSFLVVAWIIWRVKK